MMRHSLWLSLLAGTASAFWAPNHENINLQGALRATRFGDISLTAAADPRLIIPCTASQLMLLASGNGRTACAGYGAGMGYFVAENASGPGFCAQVAAPLDVPRTADYVHVFYEEPELLKAVLGVKTLPTAPTFQLTSN